MFKNIKIFINKIYNKLCSFLFILTKAKIVFGNPKISCDILVFDDVSIEDLKFLLKGTNFFVLKSRVKNITEIFISWKIIKLMFFYYEKSLLSSYLCAIIYLSKPKLLLTIIDNSLKFSEIAKIFHKEINVMAIQNARRFDIVPIKNKIFIPNFFCLGKYDIDFYKKYKIKVDKFYPVGSLRLANFLKKRSYLNPKVKFDICYMADELKHDYEREIGVKNMRAGTIKLARYILKFCLKNKFSLIIIFKDDSTKKSLMKLKEISKKNFTDKEHEFFMKSLNKKRFVRDNSYKIIKSSKVVCGYASTLLLENIAMGGKTLACNFTPSKLFDFPYKGISFLNDSSFEIFQRKMFQIYNLKNNKFKKRLNKDKNYGIFYDKKKSTINLIRNEIYKFIKN